jgi:glycosyltransferase involved in cell wall biosynthesis
MLKVIHIVPCDGIGGVEIAAKKMLGHTAEPFEFELFYIADRNAKNFKTQLWSPLYFIKACKIILRKNPDTILISLWRSVILALMIKLIRPRIKFIYFIHSTKTRHFLDAIFTRLGIVFSDVIFGDSKNSIDMVVPPKYHPKSKVISFVLTHHEQVTFEEPKPTFVFWGRLNRNKNLSLALDIFAMVKEKYPAAHFTIIGPDDGDLARLILQTKKLNIEQNVEFTGGLDLEEIKHHAAKACFYLQTSDFEGMAMAVVEAMQMGLIPVVTKVGEIREYCKDGTNSIIVNNPKKVRNRIDLLLENPKEFKNVRLKARETWSNNLLYNNSLVENLVTVQKK